MSLYSPSKYLSRTYYVQDVLSDGGIADNKTDIHALTKLIFQSGEVKKVCDSLTSGRCKTEKHRMTSSKFHLVSSSWSISWKATRAAQSEIRFLYVHAGEDLLLSLVAQGPHCDVHVHVQVLPLLLPFINSMSLSSHADLWTPARGVSIPASKPLL